jgi:hypothetical protein
MGLGTWTLAKVVVEKQFLYTFSIALEKNFKLQTIRKKTTNYVILTEVGKCT